MKHYSFFLILFVLSVLSLYSHEGHHQSETLIAQSQDALSAPERSVMVSLILWLGRLHLIFLHFPIALIVMTVVAEILFIWRGNLLFDHAARFMIVSAAVWAPITALFGFALGFGQVYEGWMNDVYAWHRYFGIVTTILALWAATLREQYARGQTSSLKSYYSCLFFLFILVNLTGLFGGTLTFGWL